MRSSPKNLRKTKKYLCDPGSQVRNIFHVCSDGDTKERGGKIFDHNIFIHLGQAVNQCPLMYKLFDRRPNFGIELKNYL